MGLFLVTFFISDNNGDLENQLVARIKEQGAWARITPTTWCIKADNITTAQLRDSLLLENNRDIRLFVTEITDSSWASYFLPQEVANWLKNP